MSSRFKSIREGWDSLKTGGLLVSVMKTLVNYEIKKEGGFDQSNIVNIIIIIVTLHRFFWFFFYYFSLSFFFRRTIAGDKHVIFC